MAAPSAKAKKSSSRNKNSPSATGTPSKRKKIAQSEETDEVPVSVPVAVSVKTEAEISINISNLPSSEEVSTPTPITPITPLVPEKIVPVFKDPNFVHSSKGTSGGKRTRIWKNLKQIISGDRTLPWKPNDVTYGLIDAPPSFRPGKKYSDLSGLEASYVDPQTKLRYATSEEFSHVRILPGDIVTGYLALRKANTPVP